MLQIDPSAVTALGMMLLSGYLVGMAAHRCKFPRVTGYILAGMLLSPSLTGALGDRLALARFSIVTDMTLAVIAFGIGGSLKLNKLKQLGKSIIVINFSEALAAFLTTGAVLLLFGPLLTELTGEAEFFYMVLVISALAAATAPAAVLAIVHECRASGPLTTTLLGVVALDDVMAIVLFAFANSLAAAPGGTYLSWWRMLFEPGRMILLSLAMGALCGYLLTSLTLVIKSQRSMLVVMLGGLLLCSGLAGRYALSPLLTTMVVGVWAANRGRDGEALFLSLDTIEEPLFVLFFTLAGAHFDLRVLQLAGPLALLIVFGRFGGKLAGAWFGARIAGAPPVVRRYLGCGLLPQAGVTVGLVLMAGSGGSPHFYQLLLNTVIGAVIINELLAPPLVRFALLRAGEGREEQL